MLSYFERHLDSLINSFNDFVRPEFCKVKQISTKKYEADMEDEKRARKFSQKKPANKASRKLSNAQNNTFEDMVEHFDNRLSADAKEGRDVYKRYLGRIQVAESEKETKILVDEKGLGAFARPFVEKYFKVATPEEACFAEAKQKVKSMISAHLHEAKGCS